MQLRTEYFQAWAVLMGLSFTGGVTWSIFGIVVIHKIEHIVTGVCLVGISAVGSVLSFVIYLLYGLDTRQSDLVRIDVREKNNISAKSLTILLCETDIVHIAVGPNTPSKIVVFESHF